MWSPDTMMTSTTATERYGYGGECDLEGEEGGEDVLRDRELTPYVVEEAARLEVVCSDDNRRGGGSDSG